ncbi:hypothetical protein MIH18_05625 [Marinobacter sp. M3C]|jgi:hypothetical protein|uniref:hypothetical protein n=1 Tax=unclassified Marinobacter TaxID=83889 RepID=UPI0020100E47|nr:MULTISPECIES: hypothetical protein [unclassified Marinobacter]MCL1477413.1 hypothetical protein [Marinobacter sp.]UQG57400.1 hypothetical protein MIH16_07095 [Marinobacter sp. M4C]UQG61422.1 hypothetical protein MIH18_05625 [Marinobacter sp. M3C]UQG66204.1 hypothetical protein MIH17_07095 [Marinobacter sp. M2C]UQG70484.1 hypothetical protein MIH19_07090 [Marinobacter sp. M1C]
MKELKEGFLFATVAVFAITSANVIASEATTERKVLIDDRYGGQHQITQKVYDQGAGFYTFVRDGRPEKLIEIHGDICQSVGGVDVFEEGTIMASDAVQDVAICKITDPKVMAKIARENPENRVSAGKPTGHDTKTAIAPRWLYWPPALSLIPPNRDVAVNINFRLSGYVEYYTDDGGFYSNSMQGGQCNISRSGIVGSDVKGTLYINVLCVARNSGTWPVYLTSSIPGLTVQAIGEIRAQ